MDILHQNRLCQARPECVRRGAGTFQRDQVEYQQQAPQAGRTEVRSRETSSETVGQEQEREMMEGSSGHGRNSRSARSDPAPETQDRKMRDETRVQATRR